MIAVLEAWDTLRVCCCRDFPPRLPSAGSLKPPSRGQFSAAETIEEGTVRVANECLVLPGDLFANLAKEMETSAITAGLAAASLPITAAPHSAEITSTARRKILQRRTSFTRLRAGAASHRCTKSTPAP